MHSFLFLRRMLTSSEVFPNSLWPINVESDVFSSFHVSFSRLVFEVLYKVGDTLQTN